MMAGLPKKYAKMGFKRGWAAYKKTKSKARTTTTRRSSKVAKRKRRSYTRKAKKSQSSMFSGVMRPLAAVAYGAIRGKANTVVRNSPIGKFLPQSPVADEAGMLLAFWGARKLGAARNKMLGSVIRAGEAIEWASVGQEIANVGFGGLFGGNNNGGGF